MRHCVFMVYYCICVQAVEGVVLHDDDVEEVPIKMWDCDSITQAKEKILDALYRNTPVSKRPQLTAIDLGMSNLMSAFAMSQIAFITL